MAHIQKYKSTAVHPMMSHYSRKYEGTLERDNIDRERTPLNRTIGASSPDEGHQLVLDRIEEVKRSHVEITGKKVRSDAVEFGDWIVTAPDSLSRARYEAFFDETHKFIQERYGAQNAPVGFVHVDETTPHMHIPVVPEKDGKLNGKAVFNRSDLQSFHRDLQAHLEKQLGCHVEILLDADKAIDKAISKLPKKEFDRLDRVSIRKEVDDLREQRDLMAAQYHDVHDKAVEAVQKRKDVLRDVEVLERKKSALTGSVEALERGLDNPLASVLLKAQEIEQEGMSLLGEFESLQQSAEKTGFWFEYGNYEASEIAEYQAEPLTKWSDEDVTIKKKMGRGEVVEMPRVQWEWMKNAHNRLVDLTQRTVDYLKTKLEPMLDYLKALPAKVPEVLRLEDLMKKLAQKEPVQERLEPYRSARKAGFDRADEITRRGRKNLDKLADETKAAIERPRKIQQQQNPAVELAKRRMKKKSGLDR